MKIYFYPYFGVPNKVYKLLITNLCTLFLGKGTIQISKKRIIGNERMDTEKGKEILFISICGLYVCY